MPFDHDPDKDAINRDKHGLGLDEFSGFDDVPFVVPDDRYDYGEQRFRAYGRIASRAFCVIYVTRGSAIRLISFRRAHEKEMRRMVFDEPYSGGPDFDSPDFDENPEWTEQDFTRARPAGEIHPPHLANQLVRPRPAPSIATALAVAGAGLARPRFAPFRLREAA